MALAPLFQQHIAQPQDREGFPLVLEVYVEHGIQGDPLVQFVAEDFGDPVVRGHLPFGVIAVDAQVPGRPAQRGGGVHQHVGVVRAVEAPAVAGQVHQQPRLVGVPLGQSAGDVVEDPVAQQQELLDLVVGGADDLVEPAVLDHPGELRVMKVLPGQRECVGLDRDVAGFVEPDDGPGCTAATSAEWVPDPCSHASRVHANRSMPDGASAGNNHGTSRINHKKRSAGRARNPTTD